MILTERKLIEGKQLHEASDNEIINWARLRRALINLKFDSIKFKDNKVMLYDGEAAVVDNGFKHTYFIIIRNDIHKILSTLPLDTDGRIKKMEYQKKDEDEYYLPD